MLNQAQFVCSSRVANRKKFGAGINRRVLLMLWPDSTLTAGTRLDEGLPPAGSAPEPGHAAIHSQEASGLHSKKLEKLLDISMCHCFYL